MQNKLEIRICRDEKFEKNVADILSDNHVIAVISQEKGIENMEIEILPPPSGEEAYFFPLDPFIETLEQAKEMLATSPPSSLVRPCISKQLGKQHKWKKVID